MLRTFTPPHAAYLVGRLNKIILSFMNQQIKQIGLWIAGAKGVLQKLVVAVFFVILIANTFVRVGQGPDKPDRGIIMDWIITLIKNR